MTRVKRLRKPDITWDGRVCCPSCGHQMSAREHTATGERLKTYTGFRCYMEICEDNLEYRVTLRDLAKLRGA